MRKHVLMVMFALITMVKCDYVYAFSAVAPSGQTLYYNIVGGNAQVASHKGSALMTGALVIPSSVEYNGTTYAVTSIVDYAFWHCIYLTSVTIPSTVTTIGNFVFDYCWDMKSMSVESGNTVYDSRENCNAIIKTETNTLLYGCKNTVIPNTVTTIGTRAFYSHTGLTSINIPNSVTIIMPSAFSGCTGLTSVTIPSSVARIGSSAFCSCSSLRLVNYTGTSAQWCGIDFGTEDANPLYYSHNLSINGFPVTDMVIPDGVTVIKRYAFFRCSGLSSVTIPNTVTSIGSLAFQGTGLRLIECFAMVPPTIGNPNTFNATNVPIYVPCGKEADYRAASYWNSFTNIQEVCGTAGATGVSVYAEGNDIVVEGAAGYTVTLNDNGGNELEVSVASMGEHLRFEGLTSGTYFVKIGVLPARMKVVVE